MYVPIKETWTIIVLGKWNVSIFSPPWLGEHVFHEHEMTMEFTMVPSDTRRITANGVILQPQSGRLVLGLTEINPDSLTKLEEAACTLLSQLPHTPVSQTGINFGFRIDEPEPNLLDHFQFSDNDWFADHKMSSISKTMNRSLTTGNGVLNLKAVIETSAIELHFNYHTETPTTETAINSIRGQVINLRDQAEFLLKDLYSLEKEEA